MVNYGTLITEGVSPVVSYDLYLPPRLAVVETASEHNVGVVPIMAVVLPGLGKSEDRPFG